MRSLMDKLRGPISGSKGKQGKKVTRKPTAKAGKQAAARRGKPQGHPGFTDMMMRRVRLWSWKQKLAFSALPVALVVTAIGAGFGDRILQATTSLPQTVSAEMGLTVENVILTGREREKRIRILSALGARKGDPILFIDLDEARTRIERLGWVKSARIARRLPDTLEIEITEHEPFALWQKDGRFNIVSDSGEIADEQFESLNGKRVAHLPQLLGEGANIHGKALMGLLANRPIVQNHFVAGRRMGNRRWDLILARPVGDNIDVKLPESGIDGALVRLESLIREQQILEKAVVAIDLRFRDRVIVKMSPGGQKKLKDKEAKA